MKILLVIGYVGFFRFFDNVIRELCAAGHSVYVAFDFRHDQIGRGVLKLDNPICALLTCDAEMPNFQWGWCIRRADRWRRVLFAARKVANYCLYLRAGRQSSKMIFRRYEDFLPSAVRKIVRYRAVRWLLSLPGVERALRLIERLIPPDRAIVAWLRDHSPDVVVASPVLMVGFEEIEYVKAAMALHVPTAVAVLSWDNLTTKGAFHVVPDTTLVWNDIQVEEALRVHGIPNERVVSTGSPVFDDWFDMQPTIDRADFCRQAGLDSAGPFALYLCSTHSIVEDEVRYVEELIEAIRRDARTEKLNLLVRPHPWYANIWENYVSDLLAVWPRGGGATADVPEARQDYFHALYYSSAVIGINTTGFIDAAVLDKPCLTLLDDRYRDTQQDMAQFQHLLRAGFLEVASSHAQAVRRLSEIVEGNDTRRDKRRQFVQQFVRPWGIRRRASTAMATAIEAVARRQSANEIRDVLSGKMQHGRSQN